MPLLLEFPLLRARKRSEKSTIYYLTIWGGNAFYAAISKVAFLRNDNESITIDDTAFYNNLSIYCYEYSAVDSYVIDHAESKNWNIIYLNATNLDEIRSITIEENNIRIPCGNSRKLGINIFPDQPEIIWSSSSPDIVMVEDGIITACQAGNATITATIGSKSVSTEISVYNIVESFNLN